MACNSLPAAIAAYLNEPAALLYLLVDPTGRVLQSNSWTRNLFGAELNQKPLADLLLSFSGPAPDPATLRRTPAAGQLLTVATARGVPESFLCHIYPVEENTLILGAVDAAENRHLQQELLTLTGQYSALTRELQKKNHQLAELNGLKNQFLGMASHDLRKPLSAILAFSEFLLDEAAERLNGEQQESLRIIHQSSDSMRCLIDDFLDISLIESGQFRLQLSLSEPAEVVGRCLALQEILARRRGISLRCQRAAGLPLLAMDGPKIEQVVNNLVANAIEHSPDGAEVVVRLEPDRQGGVVVTVADQGPGMGPEEAAALFSPFARGQAKKAAGCRSTGLGLAIAKKIVTAHGGTIGVDSQPGLGARFHFTLPATADRRPSPDLLGSAGGIGGLSNLFSSVEKQES